MNLELNVVRFESDDIMTASSVAATPLMPSTFKGCTEEGMHYLPNDATPTRGYISGTKFDLRDGVWVVDYLESGSYRPSVSDFTNGVSNGTWYHWENGKFVECENQLHDMRNSMSKADWENQ